jgi:LysM repeat protein
MKPYRLWLALSLALSLATILSHRSTIAEPVASLAGRPPVVIQMDDRPRGTPTTETADGDSAQVADAPESERPAIAAAGDENLTDEDDLSALILRAGAAAGVEPSHARITIHTVQADETLESIAEEYGVTTEALAKASFLADPDHIVVGQALTVPLLTELEAAERPTPDSIGRALATKDSPVTIGYSTLGRPIEVYTFGGGPNVLVFVGGMHGGYEWNTTALAYEAIDYLSTNPETVPSAVTVHIIPAANPDGIHAVSGQADPASAEDILVGDASPARFNANGVDLNRNWDCEWSAEAWWRNRPIDSGSGPFSEIESQVLRSFFEHLDSALQGVVFWHSQAGLVSPGWCGDETHEPSVELAAVFARAARYPLLDFSSYAVTGDASDWLAKMEIPSFTVELRTHELTDWERNQAGILALLALFEED